MALIPIDQYKKSAPKQRSFGKLKPLAPKPVRVAQAVRPDIRQSENYKNAVSQADKMAQESKKASSVLGMAQNFGKALPRATADVLIGTPAKFVASAIEAPEVAYKRNYTDRTYKVPGLTPFKSFQSDYGNVADKVIAGEKGMGSAAWELAKVPLAGIETGIGASGIARGLKALAGGQIKNAGAIVSDAFLPTNFSKGLKPLPPKAPQQASSTIEKITPLPQKTAPLRDMGAVRESSEIVFPSSSPKGNIAQSKQALSESKVPESNLSASYSRSSTDMPSSQVTSVTADKIINPVKPKKNERGFIESVRNSPEISQDLAKRVDATYDVRRNKEAQEKAQRLIFDNVSEAERIATGGANDDAVFTASELIKQYDSIAQKAKRTGNTADFEVAMTKAVEVAEKSAANLTEAGRTVQAASTINRLSPDGIIQYVNRAVREVGGDVKISNEKYYEIIRKAEEVKGILDPKQKALKTFELLDDIYEDIPKSMQYRAAEILNLPRAIMSTADLSAPLRQGLFTMARNPVTFAKNFGNMFKYAFSDNAYRNLKADIITSPNYDLYVKHKLPLTDISKGLIGREEQFMSTLAEKIPGFGALAKGSNRAYSGFLNKMRVDLFDDFVKTAELNGITDQKYFDDASKFVGSATGRGNIAKMFGGDEAGPVWNSFFFSPRLMASRLSLINPVYYTKLHPEVRKEAIKSLVAFVSTGTGILALAKLNGAEVSSDPRSADFGKIKIGDTRYDTWGGFQQYARLIGQLATGEKISTTTGKETQLGSGGYNSPTHESIVMDFLKSKANPVTSFIVRASQGEQYGEKFNLPAEVIGRFLPMVTNDIYNLTEEYGAKGAAMAVPGVFGIGSQTYGDQVPMMAETESGNPTVKWRSKPELGEAIWNKATGVELSDIPKEQWKALEEERLNEQKRQVEVNKAKALVLASGEPQYVGDTKVYLENGVVKTKKESKDKRLPLKDQLLYQELQKRKADPFYKD